MDIGDIRPRFLSVSSRVDEIETVLDLNYLTWVEVYVFLIFFSAYIFLY